MTSSWLNPPPAYDVVAGLNRLADEVVDRATPTQHPSGDRASSDLQQQLAALFQAEGRVAVHARREIKNLENILLMTISTTKEVDTFAAPPSGTHSGVEFL